MIGASADRIVIREARLEDLAAIVDFNARLALETEDKSLDLTVLTRGVQIALAEPDRLRYWVASVDERIIGQAAITREWSDWRSAWVWWFQSVFVDPEFRGQGVFRAIHGVIRASAFADPSVIGLRLYVESENHRAMRTYESLGMVAGGYLVYEELWIDRLKADLPG